MSGFNVDDRQTDKHITSTHKPELPCNQTKKCIKIETEVNLGENEAHEVAVVLHCLEKIFRIFSVSQEF